MVDISGFPLLSSLPRRVWTKSISPDRKNLVPVGNKSTEIRVRKEAGNHPPNLSDGEDVDSLPVQVNHRLRQDLNIDNPGVFDILLH